MSYSFRQVADTVGYTKAFDYQVMHGPLVGEVKADREKKKKFQNRLIQIPIPIIPYISCFSLPFETSCIMYTDTYLSMALICT